MTSQNAPYETEREGTAPGQPQPGTEHQPSTEQEAPHAPGPENHEPFGGSPEEVEQEREQGPAHE